MDGRVWTSLHCTVEMCEQQQAPGMHMLVIHIQDMYIQLPLKYIDICMYIHMQTCIYNYAFIKKKLDRHLRLIKNTKLS